MNVFYVDTSALAKLVIEETESASLMHWFDERRGATMVSSALTRAELRRAARRADEEAAEHADRALARVRFRSITDTILTEAGTLEPLDVRTLDAIHLATAIELRPSLDGLLTYDDRLATAASAHGFTVLSPGT